MGYINGADGSTSHGGVIVERGGKSDPRPSQTQAGEVVCRLPGVHGEGVQNEHLALVGPEKSLGEFCIFPGVPDHGTPVGCGNNAGSNRPMAGNMWAAVNDQSSSPGNINLMQFLQSLMSMDSNRWRPPDYQETTRDGAKVRPPKEKGPYLPGLTQNIPTHAAMATISGIRIPQLKNIPTAIQQFSSILTGDMLNNLPGSFMSIAQMLSGIMNNSKQSGQVTQNMTPQTVNALQSIVALTQSGDLNNQGGYTTGIQVNPDVFANNLVNMLSQAQTVSDILYVIEEIASNTAYHGMDVYANTTYQATTPFGNTVITITPAGEVVDNTSNNTIQAMQSYTSSMGSFSSFQSMLNGRNLFGESSGTMFDMLQRLPPEAMNTAKQMFDTTKFQEDQEKTSRQKVAFNGGDFLNA